MDFLLGILIFAVGIAASIALHELGHMVPAKKFGVRVSHYMVGFGPTIWSRTKGETEYGLKWIPLGGYVRLVGMMPTVNEVKEVKGGGWAANLIRDAREVDNEQILPGEEHRAFYRLPWWKKVIVMFGGPFMNVVIAFVLFLVIGAGIGLPSTAPVVDKLSACALPTVGVECTQADPAAPSVVAGVQEGDRIVAIDGVAITTWDELTATVRDSAGTPLVLDIERAGETVQVSVTPSARETPVYDDAGEAVLDANGDAVLETTGFLGMTPGYDLVREPWTFAPKTTWEGTVGVVGAVVNLPSNVAQAVRATAGTEERSQDGVVSVVGVALGLGQVFSSDVDIAIKVLSALLIIASVNLALFVFNMIPLLPLDGGHIAGALWGAVKDGWARVRNLPRPAPVDLARMMPVAYGVFALLIGLGAILIVADIVAPVSFL